MKMLLCVLLVSVVSPLLAQQGGSGGGSNGGGSANSGNVNVQVSKGPVTGSVSGSGVSAGVRVAGVTLVEAGVGLQPLPQPVPVPTLLELFNRLEDNLKGALDAQVAIAGRPNATKEQVEAAQKAVDTLLALKSRFGGQIAPNGAGG